MRLLWRPISTPGDRDGDRDFPLSLPKIRRVRLTVGGDSSACWDCGSPDDSSSRDCSPTRPLGGSLATSFERFDFLNPTMLRQVEIVLQLLVLVVIGR